MYFTFFIFHTSLIDQVRTLLSLLLLLLLRKVWLKCMQIYIIIQRNNSVKIRSHIFNIICSNIRIFLKKIISVLLLFCFIIYCMFYYLLSLSLLLNCMKFVDRILLQLTVYLSVLNCRNGSYNLEDNHIVINIFRP